MIAIRFWIRIILFLTIVCLSLTHSDSRRNSQSKPLPKEDKADSYDSAHKKARPTEKPFIMSGSYPMDCYCVTELRECVRLLQPEKNIPYNQLNKLVPTCNHTYGKSESSLRHGNRALTYQSSPSCSTNGANDKSTFSGDLSKPAMQEQGIRNNCCCFAHFEACEAKITWYDIPDREWIGHLFDLLHDCEPTAAVDTRGYGPSGGIPIND